MTSEFFIKSLNKCRPYFGIRHKSISKFFVIKKSINRRLRKNLMQGLERLLRPTHIQKPIMHQRDFWIYNLTHSLMIWQNALNSILKKERTMLNWRLLTVLATLFQGVAPIFHNKATGIHGVMMNLLVCQIVFVTVPLIWTLTHPQDLSLITKESFVFGVAASLVSLFYAICLFGSFKLKPDSSSEIMVTISFSIIILALINHFFLGYKMLPHQWLGAVITLLGIILVNLKR